MFMCAVKQDACSGPSVLQFLLSLVIHLTQPFRKQFHHFLDPSQFDLVHPARKPNEKSYEEGKKGLWDEEEGQVEYCIR